MLAIITITMITTAIMKIEHMKMIKKRYGEPSNDQKIMLRRA